MWDAQSDVRVVVVSLAKTPLKAAQAPEAAAMGSQAGVLDANEGPVVVGRSGGEGGGESVVSWKGGMERGIRGSAWAAAWVVIVLDVDEEERLLDLRRRGIVDWELSTGLAIIDTRILHGFCERGVIGAYSGG